MKIGDKALGLDATICGASHALPDLEPSLSVVSHSRVLTTMDVMMSGAEVETIAED